MAKGTCSVDGCDKPHFAHGLCNMHYYRMRRHGSLDDPRPIIPAIDRIMGAVTVTPSLLDTPCWLCSLSISDNGYSSVMLRDPRRRESSHRFVYEHHSGPVPDGLVVDHLCHNADPNCAGGRDCVHHRCVNPAHLEAVTQQVNIFRGKSPQAIAARTGLCQRGHSMEDAYVRADGRRACRQCIAERSK